jgi:hypothetical protein
MTHKQVKNYAQRHGLPWHPAWDKVESAWYPLAHDLTKVGLQSAAISRLSGR